MTNIIRNPPCFSKACFDFHQNLPGGKNGALNRKEKRKDLKSSSTESKLLSSIAGRDNRDGVDFAVFILERCGCASETPVLSAQSAAEGFADAALVFLKATFPDDPAQPAGALGNHQTPYRKSVFV